jgi:ricin-type beta-trefoil lectin protein
VERTISLAIRTAAIAPLVALAWLYNPLPASARPGTPNNERAFPCGPRAICVHFDNTATERVRFEANMTMNGVNMQIPRLSPECEWTKGRGGGNHCTTLNTVVECRTGATIYGEKRNILGGGRNVIAGTCLPHRYKISGLKPGAKYCLRFRARDTSDTVSERWSNWACAIPEGDAPPAPPKPKPVELSAEFYYRLTTAFRPGLFLAPISSANNSLTRLENDRESTPNQYWSFSAGDGGGYRMHSAVHGRDDCLELVTSGPDNNQPRISKCQTFGANTNAQHWTFLFINGATRIQSKARPDLCLDIFNGGPRNNQPELRKCGNVTGQRWEIKTSGKHVR